jgi:hypothetical protein
MWRRLALILALGVAWVAGCTPVDKVQSTSWLPRRRVFQGPTGPDVVQVRIAVLECRPGEAEWKYVNGELWQLADESLIDEDRRQAMNQRGFRVGKIGTQPPAKLLTLLTSKRSNPNPRDFSFRTGDPKGLAVGPALAHCRYQVERDGEPVEADQADCKLVVVASRGTDGKTVLRLTPQVVHGDAKTVYRVDEQAGSFLSVPERPTETYPQMAWEAELALNEYLLVGGSYERTETLGHQFFVRPDEAVPVQRLLVLQMGAAPDAAPAQLAPGPSGGKRPGAVPLALQASWPAARGAPP